MKPPMTLCDVFDIGMDATDKIMKDAPEKERRAAKLKYAIKFRDDLRRKSRESFLFPFL